MVAALGIVFAIAAVLAVVVTALFVGVCLLLAWITGSVSGQPRRQVRGRGGPRPAPRSPVGGTPRYRSRPPAGSRRGQW